ncbi:sodium:solute symporter family transporter [Mucisphaera sp.]|uniref:sodium:solute symporter family transporter n=1 Tax=Mucisphaera sp. TaxID=2913024 RepID=UPI003D0B5383
MHTIDYLIVAAYLLILITKSLFLAKRAAAGASDYFLAGRKMPWWALGASGMSSNLDAAGTMTIISLIYLYGLHGFFIEMRGGVVLPIAVFLAFMGKWHQRSHVVTTGEWMLLRFGNTWQGRAARYTAAFTYLIITIGMVVFFLAAAGKFLAVFLPFDATTCAVAMAIIALLYTMISGLYGVIWTDVLQAALIAFAAIYIAITAAGYVTPELLAQWPGDAYNQPTPIITTGLTPNPSETTTLYEPFILFLLFWAGKGILEGLGGSGGSAYMAQRFYASQDIPTVKKLCMLWTILFAFRWPMVLGFAILAIHLGIGQDDPEQILPGVLLSDIFPPGIRGLLVTAIFAASMSTFDSTINAGASYVVRDLYLPFAQRNNQPAPSQRAQVIAGYLASAAIVAAGLTLALLFADGVVDVWVTIVIQLFPAFLIPFALRWFWARFNGAGFTLGVITGFAAAFAWTFLPPPDQLSLPQSLSILIQNNTFTDITTLSAISLASLLGCLIGTYATQPTSTTQLTTFYRQIRPLGLWPAELKTNDRTEHTADLVRLALALTWQLTTFLLPMFAMLRMTAPTLIAAVIWTITGYALFRDANQPKTTTA